jgi:general secretion pathway protein F
MRWNPRQLEKKADRLENLASALASGLEIGTVLATIPGAERRGALPGDGFVAALRATGFALDEIDWKILDAAERAGELPAALRERAAAARFRARLVRDLLGRLAYPAVLIAATIALVVWLRSLGFASAGGAALGLLGALAALGAVVAWSLVRRARNDEGFQGAGLPGLRRLLRDIGELPYLDAFGGLYAAGVHLREAHEEALAICPVASIRARLRRCVTRLRDGEGFAAALAAESALTDESLELLTNGERIGDLEGSVGRAAQRRRDVLARRAALASRVIGAVVYAAAAAVVIYVVLDFYGGYFGGRVRGR